MTDNSGGTDDSGGARDSGGTDSCATGDSCMTGDSCGTDDSCGTGDSCGIGDSTMCCLQASGECSAYQTFFPIFRYPYQYLYPWFHRERPMVPCIISTLSFEHPGHSLVSSAIICVLYAKMNENIEIVCKQFLLLYESHQESVNKSVLENCFL